MQAKGMIESSGTNKTQDHFVHQSINQYFHWSTNYM